MRKVIFKKWIPARYEAGKSKPVDGTNCWEENFLNVGVFHQWANAYEESSEGFGNYTVALVEVPDGTIVEVLPSNIKFID
jgi:hypothetical protein